MYRKPIRDNRPGGASAIVCLMLEHVNALESKVRCKRCRPCGLATVDLIDFPANPNGVSTSIVPFTLKLLTDPMSSSVKFYVLTWVLWCSPTHVSNRTEDVE